MSKTYALVCEDCRVSLWVGQGRAAEPLYMYGHQAGNGKYWPVFGTFMNKHLGHALRLMDDDLQPEDVTEIDW